MASYVLTYDLNGNEASSAYAPLINELVRWGSFKYQFSAWLVHSVSEADAVLKHFSQFIDSNDRIWVSEFTSNWQSTAMPGISEWIAAHPPRL